MTWDTSALPDQAGRTVVVTGPTAGIGYFAAEQLARAGAHLVLAGRSSAKLGAAEASIREQVPGASVRSVTIDLASLASVTAAVAELSALPRLDGLLLNGGTMTMRVSATTADGLPLILGTHVAANVALVAGLLPAMSRTGHAHGTVTRIVHTSTGFVHQIRQSVSDIRRTPRWGVGAYTHAKTVTEIFAFALDRRLRAAGEPVASLVARPGVGVDAKTPHRRGVRDDSVPAQRNPFTPWAQGKDTAAWSAVRALTDPTARGGEYYAPEGRLKGAPVRIPSPARTASPPPELAESVWEQVQQLAGVTIPLPSSQASQAR